MEGLPQVPQKDSPSSVQHMQPFEAGDCNSARILTQTCLAFEFQGFCAAPPVLRPALGHFTQQWRDREVYWLARDRARTVRDMACNIIDRYDKAKVALPRYPEEAGV